MMRSIAISIARCTAPLIALLAPWVLHPGLAQERKGAPAARFEDKYAILVDKNIFSRTRKSAARRREEAAAMEAPPPDPEQGFVLTGTMLKDGVRFAFIEESRAQKTHKLRVGDSIARGKVAKVDFDAFEYEKDGKKTVVAVGKTLSGGSPPSSSRSEGRSRPSSGPPGPGPRGSGGPAEKTEAAGKTEKAETTEKAAPSSSGASGTESIEERLRRRRLEEDKKS